MKSMATNDKHSFRMISSLLVLLLLIPVTSAWAQDDAAEDSLAWKTNLNALLAGSQASYNNWSEGGINSLAFTASLSGDATRRSLSWAQKHEMRLAIGSIKQDTVDFRKGDDLISLVSTFQYHDATTFAKWNPTASIDFRTQFANGFDYSGAEPVKVSSFLAPATLLETVGFSYNPEEWFTWLIGLAGKQTIVGIESLRERYGNALDETMRFEVGFNTKAGIDKDIFENVHLKSSLGVFAAFGQVDEPDIRWENLVTMSVNSWLSVGFEFVTFLDKDISPDWQLKQVLSTGVTVAIL